MAASAPARVDGRTARWAGHRAQRRTAIVDAAIAVIEREGPGATVEQFGAELADRTVRTLTYAVGDETKAVAALFAV